MSDSVSTASSLAMCSNCSQLNVKFRCSTCDNGDLHCDKCILSHTLVKHVVEDIHGNCARICNKHSAVVVKQCVECDSELCAFCGLEDIQLHVSHSIVDYCNEKTAPVQDDQTENKDFKSPANCINCSNGSITIELINFFLQISVLSAQDHFCQVNLVRGSLWGDEIDLTEKVLFT